VASAKPQQLLDARGRALIERRGARRQSLGNDAYHFLRTGTWPRVIALCLVAFFLSNLAFAALFWVTGAQISNSTGFLDLYWFSVQSMATIGYGVLAPMNHVANVIVTIEAFYGILFTAMITGIVFARFSTPAPRVIFSRVAIISEHDGQRVLQFRMANERTTAIVEATIRLYMTREETLANGEKFRRVYDLPLRRATSPVFSLSFLAAHVIVEKLSGLEMPERLGSIGWGVVHLAGGGIAFLFLIIKVINHTSDSAIGLWLGLLCGAGLAAGGYLMAKEAGELPQQLGGNKGGSTPPPAA